MAARCEFGVFLWSLTAQGNWPITAVLPGCHCNSIKKAATSNDPGRPRLQGALAAGDISQVYVEDSFSGREEDGECVEGKKKKKSNRRPQAAPGIF